MRRCASCFSRRLALLLLLSSGGCRATFVDDRPPAAEDLASPAPPADLAEVDLLGVDQSGLDLAAPADRVFARGSFGGRDGHSGSGTAELVRLGSGAVELRFAADFVVSGVPGPVAVLSSRDDLGTTLDAAAGDLDLGTLKTTAGAQSYAIAAGADSGRRVAFVFCKPFGVEVARAILADIP